MTPAVEQLVRETIDLTGAEEPELLADDAPVLAEDALVLPPWEGDEKEDGFYLVGIIGGKDVGKSALVNALAGRNITAITSHGPGTEIAIAYCHASQEEALRELLDREVPGKFRIVIHDSADLRRQVLLDLPDIDSHYESHVAVTRAMLRHMLYPVWVQSVEKYADMQPQQMLEKVAAGNDARNFVFCMNKLDQMVPRPRPGALPALPKEAEELRTDFATRIARATSMEAPPPVFLISAKHPDRYDLPRLHRLLNRQKKAEEVRKAKEMAARQQDRSLLEWLEEQNLAGRAERLGRLRQEAEDAAAERIAVPLVENVIPKIADDPANRHALTEEILAERVARWPLVSLVHLVLAPLFALMRTMVAKHAVPLQGADALVESHLRSQEWNASVAVQSTFAQLRQSQPSLADLYRTRKLWEDMDADLAASDLSRRLAATVERQRAAARDRLARGGGLIMGLLRWLLTIGALIWFPVVQPVLEWMLMRDDRGRGASVTDILGRLVQVLGVNYLLTSVGFLLIYFAALWLALRWNTQRRVGRLLARWKLANDPDPALNLATQSLQWVDALNQPIRTAHERMAALAQRAKDLRGAIDKAAA